jgi:hypothetical protein
MPSDREPSHFEPDRAVRFAARSRAATLFLRRSNGAAHHFKFAPVDDPAPSCGVGHAHSSIDCFTP